MPAHYARLQRSAKPHLDELALKQRNRGAESAKSDDADVKKEPATHSNPGAAAGALEVGGSTLLNITAFRRYLDCLCRGHSTTPIMRLN